MKAIIYYLTYYIVCKTELCRTFYILAISYTPNQQCRNNYEMRNIIALDSDWNSNMETHIMTLTDTRKLWPETGFITSEMQKLY